MTTTNPELNPHELPDVIQFLLGQAPLDGVWYGEKAPPNCLPFWWRNKLRALFTRTNATAEKTVINDAGLAEVILRMQNAASRMKNGEAITKNLALFVADIETLINHVVKGEKMAEVTEIDFVRIVDGIEYYASAAELFEHLEKNQLKIIKIIDGGA